MVRKDGLRYLVAILSAAVVWHFLHSRAVSPAAARTGQQPAVAAHPTPPPSAKKRLASVVVGFPVHASKYNISSVPKAKVVKENVLVPVM